ncbi:MAG: response regulator [Lachnospiraceae bacterium]|nr:response regulator [Lachnospiraceae bacterium]
MNQTGMAPYGFLYAAIALLLLSWLALSVLTVTLRLRLRDRESKKRFRYERMFFQDVCQSGHIVYMMLRRSDKKLLYLSENAAGVWGIPAGQIRTDIQVLEGLTTNGYRREFMEKWEAWDGEGTLLQNFSRKKADGEESWYELTVSLSKGGGEYLFRFRENTYEQAEMKRLRGEVHQAQMDVKYKTDFLSNMSHEIRTPMNGILGMLALSRMSASRMDEACKSSKEYTAIVEYLDKAESLSQFLLGLINDILDMSRIESGKLELAQEPFDLFGFAEKLRTMFQKTIEEKGAAFQMELLDFDVRWVVGDELRLSQVIVNFLSNAVKFTPPGGKVTVTFRQMNRMDGKVHFMIRVRDTGKGITPEFLKRIFKPFEQETATIAKSYGGSGLGMAIADNMVKLMDGHIVVDSEVGKGSDFNVYLALPIDDTHPQDVLDGEAAAGSAAAASQEAAGGHTIEGMRILMAEDNEINAEIAISILEEMGACVERAANGQEALDMFAGHGPGYYDTVLMDIQMPVMNGWEATAAIRGLDREDAAAIPIYALSADAFVEDKRRSVSIGMNGHISKPIDFDELVKTIGRSGSER